MVIVLNDYLVHSCWGLHLSFRFLQTKGSWSTHGLSWVLLSGLWLHYYALVFVCLMPSLSYTMLWMKFVQWLSYWKLKVDFICNRCLFNSRFIFIYVIKAFITLHSKALYKYMTQFSALVHIYTFAFLYKILGYGGFNFIGTHARQ